ncbi:class I adenylate-forming enzyme family protein [Gordonia sp. SL306]|uniref:class I adenylate-forming enzyme family protein n=1 Tax=Gordonia sp. SL306 TaxID=2995145 RepID=UPI002270E4E5|nr:fatty acid--CoA ligase family protein [Gordonia sp. SL306]WAC57077.1 fatty acid--CoA ligase family protein [Gordonia sp. SL306]
MSIPLLLEMAVSTDPERIAIASDDVRVTVADIDRMSARGADRIAATGAGHVVYVGTGGVLLPLLIFASARAGLAFTPLNYRLGESALRELIGRLPDPMVIADSEYVGVVEGAGIHTVDSADFLASTETPPLEDPLPEFDGYRGGVAIDPETVAVVLFTSGTTSRPKAVELTHGNLTNYVMGTVDFASADPGDAVLICVPPYHIAGVGAALTNLFAGRRMVYQRQFEPGAWVRLVEEERITTATVVPTMLDRIVAVIEAEEAKLPSLRNLAYGGAKVPLPLVRRTLELLPHVGLVNAYGLTETSSTITVLTPDDHRDALGTDEPAIARRLGSVGRPVPGVELQIRDESGDVVPVGETGELFIRGPQVSGKYSDIGSVLDGDGWFPTKDVASFDADGYLYIGGRSDDTIIRGGENIAPAEVEDVLVEHPQVRSVAVIGVDDVEWGQAMVAVVVPRAGADPDPEELRAFVRDRLRGSRTPDRVVFRDDLPTTPTGKLLRRVLVAELRPVRAE